MAEFLFRILKPGERGGGGGGQGGAYAARKIFRKFSENFEYFFGLHKGGEGSRARRDACKQIHIN